jgi:hypothetical protein
VGRWAHRPVRMRDLERAVNNLLSQDGTSDFASFFKLHGGRTPGRRPRPTCGSRPGATRRTSPPRTERQGRALHVSMMSYRRFN